MTEYVPTIGIECHVQLSTKTKLFSRANNDAREQSPNSTVTAIDFGLPGMLPVLNQKAVELSVKAGLALGSTIALVSRFDRKHYFYPDLPKGYQISQLHEPIIGPGKVEVPLGGGESTTIRIHHAHLEEDAGKLTHPAGADYSLVDLNRAGTPMIEIVSEADMHSAAVARAYARELYLLMTYAKVTHGDLYHGNMRFDVNISVAKKDASEWGKRAEVKNLNSFRAVEKVVEYEFKRQVELTEKGERVVQETRGWDEAKQKTFSQRSKEDAQDYRYMPEPDVPPIVLEQTYVEKIKSELPTLPSDWRTLIGALGVQPEVLETLLDAQAEHPQMDYLKCIKEKLDNRAQARFGVNWYVNFLIPLVREDKFKLGFEGMNLVWQIYELVEANKLSSTNAKALYADLVGKTNLPDGTVEAYAEANGFTQVSDEAEIEKIVEMVLADPSSQQSIAAIKAGSDKAIGFLVGQVMKASKGKANPTLVQKIIKKKL